MRSGTYPPNPFKEVDPPAGSPDWSDVSDDSDPASPNPPEREDQRIEELMEELMEELDDVGSESSASIASESEGGESVNNDEVIVSSGEASSNEVIVVSDAEPQCPGANPLDPTRRKPSRRAPWALHQRTRLPFRISRPESSNWTSRATMNRARSSPKR